MAGNLVTDSILKALEASEDIEGVFVFGSLANQNRDAFSDVEIGIVSKNTADALENLTKSIDSLLNTVGKPIQVIRQIQKHTEYVSALYGKAAFPPIGLEVRLVFGQLRYLQEMVQFIDFEVLMDKGGKLTPALDKLRRVRSAEAIA